MNRLESSLSVNAQGPFIDLFDPDAQKLLAVLFTQEDSFGIATKVGDERSSWKEGRSNLESLYDRLGPYYGSKNLYFTPSVYRTDTTTTRNEDVLAIPALCFDVDFGEPGHNDTSPFNTRDEALAAINTAHFCPSFVCDTGNGFHVYYILSQRLAYLDNPEGQKAFDLVAKALKHDLAIDSTPSPSNFFRVPGTPNLKPDGSKEAYVIVSDLERRYDIDTLVAFARQTVQFQAPIDPEITSVEGAEASPVEDRATLLDRLPHEMRVRLQTDPTSERSEHFHGLVAQLYREGFVKNEITLLMSTHVVARERYGKHTAREVERCLKAIQALEATHNSRIDPLRTPEIIDPDTLRPLSAATERKRTNYIDRYCPTTSVEKRAEITATARFVEDRVISMERTGKGSAIDEEPGQGKSVAAKCHIAAHAGPDKPYALAVESLEKLDEAAAQISELSPELSVGKYHGWREDECHALSGKPTAAHLAGPRPKAGGTVAPACQMCTKRESCGYHNREDALRCDVIVTTHESLRRLLSAGQLNNHRLLVDEAPSLFRSESFHAGNLDKLADLVRLETGMILNWRCLLSGDPLATTTTTPPFPPRCKSKAGLDRSDFLHFTLAGLRTMEGFRDAFRDLGLAQLRMKQSLQRGWIPGGPSIKDLAKAHRELRRLKNLLAGETGDTLCLFWTSNDGQQVIHAKRRLVHLEAPLEARAILLGADIANDPSLPFGLHLVRRERRRRRPELRLTVFRNNFFASKLKRAQEITLIMLNVASLGERHAGKVLVCRPKVASGNYHEHRWPEEFERSLHDLLKIEGPIPTLDRGQFKGTNAHADATLVILSTVPFFSTIPDVAMTDVLRKGRSRKRNTVLKDDGYPNMSNGRFIDHEIHRLAMLNCLSSMNQALNRSALRRGEAVDALVCIPDAQTFSLFWRVFRPGFVLSNAWRDKVDAQGDPTAKDLAGFYQLICMQKGEKISKRDAASTMGYPKDGGKPERAWPNSKAVLIPLLEPFFEIAQHGLTRNDSYLSE